MSKYVTPSNLNDRDWLAAQLAAGGTAESISRGVGVAAATVSKALRRHGLISGTTRKVGLAPLVSDREWFAARLADGHSLSAIAGLAGCSRQTVVNWAARHDLPTDEYARRLQRERNARAAAAAAAIERKQATFAEQLASSPWWQPGWLEAQFAAGRTLTSIAVEYDVTVSGLCRYAQRHGIPVPQYRTPPNRFISDPVWFAARVAEGAGLNSIARAAGCNWLNAKAWAQRHGIVVGAYRNSLNPLASDPVWFAARVAEGASLSAIASAAGCDWATARSWARIHGITVQRHPPKNKREPGVE